MKILNIEGCNYIDFPVGGQLTFAKQLMTVFGNDITLVGFVTDDSPLGVWHKRIINDIEYDFFALFRAKNTSKKPLVPRRLRVWINLVLYKEKILQVKPNLVVTQSPEVVIPVSGWGYKNFCYYIAGAGNPLALSRRRYARLLAGFYDSIYFPALKKISVVLAAADNDSIKDLIRRSKNILKDGDIKFFPTRIDTNVFKNMDKDLCREKLNIDKGKIVISTSGRLHWVKGWNLMLDAYQIFLKHLPESIFYFIGDGNDRLTIEKYITDNKLLDKVVLLGSKPQEVVSQYINASNLFVMGSFMEGWATSMVEAKACGTPVCATNFSSAKELINIGVDGYIVDVREPNIFAEKMLEALNIKVDTTKLKNEIQKYSLDNLKTDFLKVCNFPL